MPDLLVAILYSTSIYVVDGSICILGFTMVMAYESLAVDPNNHVNSVLIRLKSFTGKNLDGDRPHSHRELIIGEPPVETLVILTMPLDNTVFGYILDYFYQIILT